MNITVMPLRYWWKSQKSNKKSKKTDRETTFGRFPDVLAEVLFPLITVKKLNPSEQLFLKVTKSHQKKNGCLAELLRYRLFITFIDQKYGKKNPFVK